MDATMWDDARAYDLATGLVAHDLPYWQSLVEEYRPGRVLELACGTGRITLPLVDAGAAVRDELALVGLDASASFLRRAGPSDEFPVREPSPCTETPR